MRRRGCWELLRLLPLQYGLLRLRQAGVWTTLSTTRPPYATPSSSTERAAVGALPAAALLASAAIAAAITAALAAAFAAAFAAALAAARAAAAAHIAMH